jgi:uncharacterized pyridoxamine 5'-phosphate oxidase family protein
MFGPFLGKSPQTLKKPGIWDDMDPDITSTPMRLQVNKEPLQINKFGRPGGERSRENFYKEDKKKLGTSLFGSSSSRQEGGPTRKEDKKHSLSTTKLEDAEKKGQFDSGVNIKEKNFWSKQFSRYCEELEDLLGQPKDPLASSKVQKENRQCFDTLLHGIEAKNLLDCPIAIVQNKFVMLFWNEKQELDTSGHIRIYSIGILNKSKREIDNKEVLVPRLAQESLHKQSKVEEDDKGNHTPGNDFQFLGFFNTPAIIKSSKFLSSKAIHSNIRQESMIILSYNLSANQHYVGVVLSNLSGTEFLVKIYEVPSLKILITSETQQEIRSNINNSFKPFFSYSNSFGNEMDPDYFIVPCSTTVYYLDVTRRNGNKTIEHFRPVRLINDSSMAEDLAKISNLQKVQNRDLLLGTVFEKKTTVDYLFWSSNKQRGIGFERLQTLKLEIATKYSLLLDTVSADLKTVYAFQKGAKDVVKVYLKTSSVKSVFKYAMEHKTIACCLVVDNGRYLILGDSANEVRIYRKNQRTYQNIYSQYMVEHIEEFKLSLDFKHLVVLTPKKLFSIRVNLGQSCSCNLFGKKEKLESLNGVFLGKNKKIVRFVDENYQHFSTYIDDIHGFRFEVCQTGLISPQESVIQIPQTDQFLVWDAISIKMLSPPIQSCTHMNGSLFRHQYPSLTEESTSIIELYAVKTPGVSIKDIKLNLDNVYLFIYLGDMDSSSIRTIDVLHIQDQRTLFNISETEFDYCILRENDLILRWKKNDLTSIEHGFYSNGDFQFEPISVDKRKRVHLIEVRAVFELGIISKVVFITSRKLFIFDVSSMVILCRSFPMHLESIKVEISPDSKFIAINERSYRSLLIYGLELNESGDFESFFQLSSNFVETLRFVFSHDSEFLVCLDEEFVVKIVSLRLKKEISQLNIREYLPDLSVDLTHMFFSEYSYHLVLCFRTDKRRSKSGEGFLFLHLPFYSTRFSPLDSILGYYIQRYFYSSNLLEKSLMCKNLVNIVQSYPHYQVAINNVFTAMILLMNSPHLVEQYCSNFLDFNVLCLQGLLKFSLERNKFFSLISYNSLFTAYTARTRETPYIDEEQIETLSRLEKSKMNNRYSRAVLSQIVFSFVRTEYGELKRSNKNLVPLPLNYKPHQLEEAISLLMKEDFSVINKYHCYVSQIPMDLSTGSEFSIAFFSNISNYSEEEIQTKYKVFIFYKWSKIFFFALVHALLYWIFNIFVYLYMGKYVDHLWLAICICVLDLFFIMYEVRCFMASIRHYFQDAWNQFDFINHISNLAIILAMILIEEDEKVFVINLLRFFSTLLIGIRGISLLVIFNPTRHITTMFFQVCIQIWPFLIVLAYIVFIATQAWSIEPQIERSELPEFSFMDALNVVINTSMGNFNTATGEGQTMTNLQLILIILVNVVLGLAMLNFLIAFISEIYQKISDKRDYYEVLELLPIIQQFDLLFKKRKEIHKTFTPGQVLQINEQDDPYHTLVGSQIIQTPLTEPKSSVSQDLGQSKSGTPSQNLKELYSKPSFMPNMAKKIAQFGRRNNLNRFHYLTIIPDIEQNDQLRDLKTSLHASVREMTQEIGEQTAELSLKTERLRHALRDLHANQSESKALLLAVVNAQELLAKRLDFAAKGRGVSATSIPDFEESDKTGHHSTAATILARPLRDESEDSDSLRSDGETDHPLNGNLVNG